MVQSLNVTNDVQLSEARRALLSAIGNVDVKDLRKDVGARTEVKTQVDDILSKFNF
jgi:hypothetical protein